MPRTGLKDFQKKAVASACGFLEGCLSSLARIPVGLPDAGARRAQVIARQGGLLFEAPTGAGKTLMAGETAERLSLEHKLIWLWFAPFEGLISQSASTFRDEFTNLRVRDLAKDRAPEHLASGAVFLTTWASVAVAVAASRKIRQETEELPSVDVLLERARETGFSIGVVVDEAHHSFRKETQAMAFYRDVLKPDLTILVTATPDDRDVTDFEKAMGLKTQHIGISRKQGVLAGLLKKGVKVAIFKAKNPKDEPLIDFRRTAVMQGVRQHLAIKEEFQKAGINLVPLLLVQVENTAKDKASADTPKLETIQNWIASQGIPLDSIKIHTADEPTPDLIGIAHDEEVEVLIFKMAVAMGFDAPRAHTLVSLRPTRDPNFGIQIVGRIMRVHRKVQAAVDVPESLNYGYVFLKESGVRYARMLSSLSYSRILDTLKARAFDAGIEIHEVNPAYTSIVGRKKFAKRYGLSGHGSAALVIARRASKFTERPTPSNGHGTSRVPARKRTEHVWSYWGRVLGGERRLQRTPDRRKAIPKVTGAVGKTKALGHLRDPTGLCR